MEIWYGIIGIAIGLLAGIMVGIIIRKNVSEKTIGSAEQHAKNIVLDAEHQAETIKKEKKLEAQEEALKMKNEIEKEIKQRRNEISKSENRLIQKEETIDKKLEQIERKEQSITDKEEGLNKRKKEVEEIHKRQLEELEKISGYTRDEAKQILLDSIENDVKVEASTIIKEVETRTKEEADKRAKNIIVNAIQRCAADHVAESTVSVVSLPNEEMKGRIIGREGRNIRALETATGIELIIDDTPEAVILSGFDPVRREVAKITLEKLIVDGRIHPARIEEMVGKAEREVRGVMKEAGEQVTFDLGIHNLHPELIKLLGRLKYRTSYGQNVLKHKESAKVIEAMRSHHGDYEPTSMEAVIIAAADALSAARPGARRETLETYIKRLETLEQIANTTEGVEKSYAIQAGREIRIVAKPDKIRDDELPYLARQIAKKIENELNYPGQIKVNILRETRAVDYAK